MTGIVLLLGQVLLLVFVGKRWLATSTQQLATGNQQASAVVIGLSLTGTSIALSGTLVLGQQFFLYGLFGLLVEAGGIAGLLILAVLAPRIRASGARTLPELAGQKLGRFYHWYVLAGLLVAELLLIKLALQGLLVLLPDELRLVWLLPVPLLLAIVPAGLSGAYGLIRVSAIRFVIYLLLLSTLGLASVYLPDQNREMLWPVASDSMAGTGFFLCTLFLVPHLFGGNLYMRIFAATNPREARKGVLLAVLGKVLALVVLLFFLVGAIRTVDRSVLEGIAGHSTALLELLAAGSGSLPYALLAGGLGLLLIATMEMAATAFVSSLLLALDARRLRSRIAAPVLLFVLSAGMLFISPEVEKIIIHVYGFWIATSVVVMILALVRQQKPVPGTLIVAFLFAGFVYVAAVVQQSPGDPMLWGLLGSVLGALLGAATSRIFVKHGHPPAKGAT